MQVGESVVNAIVEYHAQGSEEAHAEETGCSCVICAS